MVVLELRVEVVVPKGCEKGEVIDVTTPRGAVLAVKLPPEACEDDLVVVHYTHESDIVGVDVHHNNAARTHVLEVRNPKGSVPGERASARHILLAASELRSPDREHCVDQVTQHRSSRHMERSWR